jgi:hypothetical protein
MPQLDPDVERWDVVGQAGGVTLRSWGAGTPLFVFPGMEGSGESCLDLVASVVRSAPRWSPPPPSTGC